MSNPEKPELALLIKLGSIVVHADEYCSENGHDYDRLAIIAGLNDPSIQQWIKDMGIYLPLKRKP